MSQKTNQFEFLEIMEKQKSRKDLLDEWLRQKGKNEQERKKKIEEIRQMNSQKQQFDCMLRVYKPAKQNKAKSLKNYDKSDQKSSKSFLDEQENIDIAQMLQFNKENINYQQEQLLINDKELQHQNILQENNDINQQEQLLNLTINEQNIEPSFIEQNQENLNYKSLNIDDINLKRKRNDIDDNLNDSLLIPILSSISQIKNKSIKKQIEQQNINESGSFCFKYSVTKASAKLRKEFGLDADCQILTPVRSSLRNQSSNTQRYMSDKNIYDQNIVYIPNNNEILYKQAECENIEKINLLKQKSIKKNELKNILKIEHEDALSQNISDFNLQEKSPIILHSNPTVEMQQNLNDFEIDEVINPDINGNGNYALIKPTQQSLQKLKLVDTKLFITPLRKFNKSQKKLAEQDLENYQDCGYYPFTDKVQKALSQKMQKNEIQSK